MSFSSKKKNNDNRKKWTRIICLVMAGLLILSSVAAIFGVFS